MSFVIGRGRDEIDRKPTGRLGSYRALDGSAGAPLYLDVDRPHAVLVVGKRGYGKSYTMGVIAEELAQTEAIAPIIVDPMGAFDTLGDQIHDDISATVFSQPAVTPNSLEPRSWCTLLGLSPESSAGALLWQSAQRANSLDGMQTEIRESDATQADKRAAINHVEMAHSWAVFDAAEGLNASTLSCSEITVLDLSGLDDGPMNAVVRGVAESVYRARVRDDIGRLPWLLVDEAHTFFQGVAQPALERILTRGRAPGVSTVLVTQRPSAVPAVGISQSDILISHRLTAQSDVDALQAAQPTYMNGSLEEKMPTATGEVLIVDDATETVHAAQIRDRETEHGGDSVTATEATPVNGAQD
ncbi:ATP-binding protein [Halovenus halobia]|uniref:ATP-binding protein n=1 Tax=Halovenus halobia TaxID=3396622 RepID=UPI003F57BAEB